MFEVSPAMKRRFLCRLVLVGLDLLYTVLIEPEGEEVRIFHTLQFCLCFMGRPIHISEDFMTMKYTLHMFVVELIKA